MAQAGNAIGLFMILPLADFFPRRQFTLILMGLTTIFWLGACCSNEYTPFVAFTFLSALFTPVTQLLLPLVSELSTSRNRAFNLSIMSTGPTLGIFLGRVISGLITDHTSWRNVYWLALGLQLLVLFLLMIFMPEYGTINSVAILQLVKTYHNILWSIPTLYYKHPILVQAGLLSFSTFFAVSSFWTNVTFLLAGPIYNYTSSQIGLLGLIGLATMFAAPFCGKYLVQPLGEPLYSAAVGKSVSLVGVILGTFLGTHSIAGPILEALLLDIGLVILQISNRVSLHPLEPQMRNRVNTAFVIILYLGQLVGTKAGTLVYSQYGGWIASGGLSIAVLVLGYVIIGLRGPHARGWIGWRSV
ncbi:major facilitator superfamily domain-containing protein [Exophiala viscosa]|uniref:Major facilitator superfamily domain-containing protein n=2 Tax=Exophiala viscosa TaxID=2486360 RepID=A0AAN6DZB7_9EURO|nr:major facilitator superfamily domain-containing protein [Exophiala viscosa]